MMVLMDVVYNHFGPDGNYLHAYAPQFFDASRHTPWGAAINFDGPSSASVRDFFVAQRALLGRASSASTVCASTRSTRSTIAVSPGHRDRDRAPRCATAPDANARCTWCSRTTATRRATWAGRAGAPADREACPVERRRPPRVPRAADRASATATTPTMPTNRSSGWAAAWRKGFVYQGEPSAFRVARTRAANRVRSCPRRPSSISCRPTTRSATGRSASASTRSPIRR